MTIRRWATFSDDGRYRWWLRREWGPGATLLWIMLNPSKANDREDDATIRRCLGFTNAWGYQSFEVVNLYGLIATNPAVLLSVRDPVGLENDLQIRLAMRRCAEGRSSATVVAAWGASASSSHMAPLQLSKRVAQVRAFVREEGVVLHSLGQNADGSPRHPLRLAASTLLERWP